jgi:hypothetical protein
MTITVGHRPQMAAPGPKAEKQIAVWFAAGPGSPIRGASAPPTVTGMPPSPGTTTWVSGSPGRFLTLESLSLRGWERSPQRNFFWRLELGRPI